MARTRRTKWVLNCLPSQGTERDWRYEHADQAGLLAAAPARIPRSKDLPETWWRIGDQGATGSCVGCAGAEGGVRWHLVKAGQLSKNERLSSRFLWMASKETDQFISQPTTFLEITGTSHKSALDVARKYGVVHDKVLSFASGKLYEGGEETFHATAAEPKIASYFKLTLSGSRALEDWRSWIATKGPILTRPDVDRPWYESKQNNGKLDPYRPETARGGHAVSIVGYTADRFIVRNSWGTTEWGDKGFGYATPGYAEEAFTEAYGVSV